MSEVGNIVVEVRPVAKTWLPDGHDGEYRYTNCAEHLAVQFDIQMRYYKTGLTEEDEVRLEKKLKLEPGSLNKYNTDFWGDFKRTIPISNRGIKLYLNNPADELTYKILLAHSEVANNEKERFTSPEYKYVITSPEQEAVVKNNIIKLKRQAYAKFGKMNTDEMKDFLKVAGKKVDDSATVDLIESTIGEIIENNPNEFMDILEDDTFKLKAFISDALACRAMKKSGSKYMLYGGDTIGISLSDTIDYLKDPVNADVYNSLKAKIEAKDK